MRNNILFVLLILFSFYNCYAAKEKEREISVHNEKYVFTSKDAEQYYQMTPDSVKYVCCNTDSLPMAVFMPNDQLCNGIPQFRSIILCDLLLYIDVTFWYLSIDLGLFWGSWFLHRHKIPHPNPMGGYDIHKEILFIQ